MKDFPPGATVRVAHDARIVALEDPSNPFWYRVRYSDGSEAVVNVARITYFADQVKATIDEDGSIQIISNRLTAEGARDLFHWLRTHYADFEAVLASTSLGETISGNEPSSGSTT